MKRYLTTISKGSFLNLAILVMIIVFFNLFSDVFQCSTGGLPFSLLQTTEVIAAGSADKKGGYNESGVDDCCNPELIDILNARMRELDKRSEELDRRERELDLVKSDIEEKFAQLKELQKKLEDPVNKAVEDKEKNFQHLVGVYSKMDPAQAAVLLDRMSEQEVARILAAMKSKKVAAIFSSMDPVKAAKISAMISE